MKKILIICFLLNIPLGLAAQIEECPAEEVLNQFIGFGDLFLGELHGTKESPMFVQCLVEEALQNSQERIIVSLELPSSAREPTSEFWKVKGVEDGRSSQAMFQLVMFLVEKESQALLNLHFQHRTRMFSAPSESASFQSNRAEGIGLELKELSDRGLVIAFAGNFHSMKEAIAGMPEGIPTEGMFTGSSFTHIRIDSINGGEAWNCTDSCGIHSVSKQSNFSSESGSLINGASYGHDFIYLIHNNGFTASEPVNINSR